MSDKDKLIEKMQGTTNLSIISDTLCELGDLDDEETHTERLAILSMNLSSKSSRVREGAILGLSRLGDPRSIDDLKAARENEPYEFLQGYMEQVIEALKDNIPLKSLDIPQRIKTVLGENMTRHILFQMTASELFTYSGLGRKSLIWLKKYFTKHGRVMQVGSSGLCEKSFNDL